MSIFDTLIYFLRQRSVSVQEVVCPLCSEMDNKSLQIRVADGRVPQATLMQQNIICAVTELQSFPDFNHVPVAMGRYC